MPIVFIICLMFKIRNTMKTIDIVFEYIVSTHITMLEYDDNPYQTGV